MKVAEPIYHLYSEKLVFRLRITTRMEKENVVITNKHVPKKLQTTNSPSSSEPKKPGQPEPKKVQANQSEETRQDLGFY